MVPREPTYPERVHNRNTDVHLYPEWGSSPHRSLRALDNGRHPRKCGQCGLHAVPQKALYLPLRKEYDGQGRVVPPSFNSGTRRRQSVSFTPWIPYPWEKRRRHPLNRWLCVPGNRAQFFGEKDVCLCRKSKQDSSVV